VSSREIKVWTDSDDLFRILKRTNKANPAPEDVAALRRALQERPDLWHGVADLARQVRATLIGERAGDSALFYEAMQHGLAEMEAELGYGQASPLERLLIEQVLLGWLEYHDLQDRKQYQLKQGCSMAQMEFLDKRVSRAHHRYLQAIGTLAKLRKRSVAVQVNIAQQQVNLAAPVTDG
jgi:hypothetical protein